MDRTLSISEIDAQIEALKAKKRALNKKPSTPRTPRVKKEKKQVRHRRLFRCINCGKSDKRTNMERVSKYEYQHPICERIEQIVKVGFAFND